MDTSQPLRTKPISFLNHPSSKRMAWFLKRVGSLLKEGFSLKEALRFIQTLLSKESEEKWVQTLYDSLEAGDSLDEGLALISFPDHVVSQVYFASIHGKYAEAIYQAGVSLEEKAQRKQKILTLLAYPSLLLLFMTGLLLSMRSVLLPYLLTDAQTGQTGWERMGRMASSFVQHFPSLLLIGASVIGLSFFCIHLCLKKRSAVEKAVFFSRWPLAGPLVKLYYSQLFSQEWGQLFESGLEMHSIVKLMQQKNMMPLIQGVGAILEKEFKKGNGFSTCLSYLSFLNTEFSRVVSHGETSGHLGKELLVYGEECLQEMERRIEKLMTYIQPLSFLVISFLIISVYGALLLPMLSNMEGIL